MVSLTKTSLCSSSEMHNILSWLVRDCFHSRSHDSAIETKQSEISEVPAWLPECLLTTMFHWQEKLSSTTSKLARKKCKWYAINYCEKINEKCIKLCAHTLTDTHTHNNNCVLFLSSRKITIIMLDARQPFQLPAKVLWQSEEGGKSSRQIWWFSIQTYWMDPRSTLYLLECSRPLWMNSS